MAADYLSVDKLTGPLADPIGNLCKAKDKLQDISDAEFPKKWLSRTLKAELLKYISESNAVDPESDSITLATRAIKAFEDNENGVNPELHSALLAYRNVTELPNVKYRPVPFSVKMNGHTATIEGREPEKKVIVSNLRAYPNRLHRPSVIY